MQRAIASAAFQGHFSNNKKTRPSAAVAPELTPELVRVVRVRPVLRLRLPPELGRQRRQHVGGVGRHVGAKPLHHRLQRHRQVLGVRLLGDGEEAAEEVGGQGAQRAQVVGVDGVDEAADCGARGGAEGVRGVEAGGGGAAQREEARSWLRTKKHLESQGTRGGRHPRQCRHLQRARGWPGQAGLEGIRQQQRHSIFCFEKKNGERWLRRALGSLGAHPRRRRPPAPAALGRPARR
jgi:hypothetical protein